MGVVDVPLVKISEMSEQRLEQFLKENALALTAHEARRVVELIGRDPTITEIHIFNIQWSEHSSYKSSRNTLKTLPTKAPNVILGPVEDSGIVELGTFKGEKYGIVVSHESHNHPSQVVPYEGAATGVGGIIRDVLCMGATVLATADPLRFGNPNGKNKNKVKYIANEVIEGIAGYSNAVGIPNIAGDVYFNESFDENCLVNVVCLGILKEKDIIHSYAPKNAVGYDIILVGKATDNSGFGGAAFASLILNDEAKESNRGAVQVPDPFLKNVLIRASYAVFQEAKRQKVILGFKDLGAGGIMCATSELCADKDYGAFIDLDKVPTSLKNLPPFIIACSETQERFCWISPKDFTPAILKIYNNDFDLNNVALGAQAAVIGTVTKEQDYVVTYQGEKICNSPIKAVTSGIRYDLPSKEKKKAIVDPKLDEPKNYPETILKILRDPAVASKARCYDHYDKNVQGNAIIESGQADAGLIRAIPGSTFGIALSVDNNPKYGRIDPYWGAVNAVAESMRNVAAIGAIPSALTDCLNFGNPKNPQAFFEFKESVRGIKESAENITYYQKKHCVPIISGNVSFYNESKNGNAIDPSPIIACVGVMKDYRKAITMQIQKPGSTLCMIGPRKAELGGSVYYGLKGELGNSVPKIDFEAEKMRIHAIIDAIDKELLLSCHDISDGGLATAVSEMVLGGNAKGQIGVSMQLDFSDLRPDIALFSESSGFIFEISPKNLSKVRLLFKKYKVGVVEIGTTTNERSLRIKKQDKELVNLTIEKLKEAWTRGFVEVLE